MIKRFILLLVCGFSLSQVLAQDTVWVNTLNFGDITKRKGTYSFPEADQYRKVRMHYTLKCDPQTKQDNYNCGEWDYLSYVIVHDSTGKIDSNRLEHSNFMLGDLSPDMFEYVKSPISDTFYYYQIIRKIDLINSLDSTTIGLGKSSENLFASERTQYLYSGQDLANGGLKPGKITSISFFNSGLSTLSGIVEVLMRSESAPILNRLNNNSPTTVFKGKLNVVNGKNEIVLQDAFEWDGSSNVVIEFVTYNLSGSANISVLTDPAINSAISNVLGDNYYQVSANDFMDLANASTVFSGVDSFITIAFWANGSDALPVNNSFLEAEDKDGNRLLNIHLPWGNGQIFWDAGNSEGYDRINKAANAADYKNGWNHYAFVKNSSTGSMKIYLNGNLWHSAIDKTGLIGKIEQFRVGRGTTSSNQYQGKIDRINVWKTELSQAEIADMLTKEISSSHPKFASLLFSFSFDNYNGSTPYLLASDFNSSITANLKGDVTINSYQNEAFFQTKNTAYVPKMQFVQADMTSHLDSVPYSEIKARPITIIEKFDDVNNPTQTTGFDAGYASGYAFSFNPNGTKKDSTMVSSTHSIIKKLSPYYVKFEVVNNVEIARYITPYGIGLDLGPNGFKWIYDVTDYADLLNGNVTISAGNQQELIDLKFEMIKGTPPRNLIERSYYINRESRTYKNIADDVYFKNDTIGINKDAKTFKLVTRITGHGHNTDNDTKPHCCEWADKQHYLNIDGKNALQWDIWQNDKCALNPVYPQGGNWAPPRAGWCPGAPVDDYNFDITQYVSGESVALDYEIEPVPTDNLGQGGGNYVVSMHLMQYGDYNFETDATVEEIISPNNWEYYSRINPTCATPKIRIRNTGKNTIEQVVVKYGVIDGYAISYPFNITLKSDEATDIDLPFALWAYNTTYKGNTFYAEIISVNGKTDDYAINNRAEANYNIPGVAPRSFDVFFRNNSIEDATVQIFDDQGKVVYEKLDAPAGQLFKETVTLNPGCYKMVCKTENEFGLTYPLIPQIGSGLIRFYSASNGYIQNFNANFGKSIEYYFTVAWGLGVEPVLSDKWQVYPNPTNGLITLSSDGVVEAKDVSILVTDLSGKKVYEGLSSTDGGLIQIDLQGQVPGIYFLEMIENNQRSVHKIVIQ
ncbi:MAG: T9SS type A sorting domain-containing protein [Flavobacteriales bacterium]|nr:T9SS type A sorting domain-containing protein [Flavobacteriales bacterium]